MNEKNSMFNITIHEIFIIVKRRRNDRISGWSITVYAVVVLLLIIAGTLILKEQQRPKETRRQQPIMVSMGLLLAASLLQLIYGISTEL